MLNSNYQVFCLYCRRLPMKSGILVQWHKDCWWASVCVWNMATTQVQIIKGAHKKTEQSRAYKCAFSSRLVCFAFEFTRQLAAMRNETQHEAEKNGEKMSAQDKAKRGGGSIPRDGKVETAGFSHVAFYIRTHSRVTIRPSSKQFTSRQSIRLLFLLLLWKTESMRKATMALPHWRNA